MDVAISPPLPPPWRGGEAALKISMRRKPKGTKRNEKDRKGKERERKGGVWCGVVW